MEKYFLSIPFVKDIYDENENLRKQIKTRDEKIAFLNNNLSSLSQKYTELFFRNNRIKITASIDNNTYSENKSENKGSNEKNNIELK